MIITRNRLVLGSVALVLVLAPLDAGCRPPTTTMRDGGITGGDAEIAEDADYTEETCTPDADDTFCPAYAEAFCRGHFDCCEATDDPGTRYATMELCVQRTTCICVAHRTGAAFEDGRVTFDEAAATALLTRIDEAADTCSVLPVGSLEPDAAFVGTLSEGASCAPTSVDDYSNLFTCADGLYCFVTDFGDETTPPTADCRRYRAEGESCDATGMMCAPGLTCGPGATIDDGICIALLADGAPCDEDFECASDFCDDTAGNTCAAIEQDDTWCVDADITP